MADITHRIAIRAPRSKVQGAVSTAEGIATWWTRETTGAPKAGEPIKVVFGHRTWRDVGEFMAHCSMKWATFLQSLRELLETGRGKPRQTI